MTLVLGERSAIVRPASLPARHVLGALCVQLDELWAASRLPVRLLDLTFDFVGEDGFRPSSHGSPPLAGALLEQGYFQLETGDLAWEAAADLACVYHVKATTTIIAVEARDAPIDATGALAL